MAARLGLAAMAALFLVKLWSVSELDLVASHSPHDSLWMVRKAAVSYWRDYGYNHMAFIKEPGMPLFLAACRDLGIPARLAFEVVLALSAFVLAGVVARLGARGFLREFLRVSVFAAVIFFPPSVLILSYPYPDSLSMCLSVLWLAAGLFLVTSGRFRESFPAMLGLVAVSFGMAVTRPETEFVILAFAGACGLRAASAFFEPGARRRNVLTRLVAGLAGLAGLMGLIEGVKMVNFHKAGFRAISEQTEGNFRRALYALRSVPCPPARRYLIIDAGGLDRAARVSPAVAEVRDALVAAIPLYKIHRSEKDMTFDIGEAIFPSHFSWALRDAVAAAGRAHTAKQASAFYRRMADEIEAAQNAGTLARRPTLDYYLAGQPGETLAAFAAATAGFWRRGLKPDCAQIEGSLREGRPPGADIEAAFDFGASRRQFSATVSREPPPVVVEGWFFEMETGAGLTGITGDGPLSVSMVERPDVGGVMGALEKSGRWGFKMHCREAGERGGFVFQSTTGREYPVPADGRFPLGATGRIHLVSSDGSRALVHIDGVDRPVNLAERFERPFRKHARFRGWVCAVWPWLVGGGICAAIGGLAFTRRASRGLAVWVFALAFGFIAARYAFLAFIDTWYFSAFEIRYSAQADILVLPALILLWGVLWFGRPRADGGPANGS